MPPFTLYKSPIHPSNSKLCATHSRTHWTASITQDTIVYSFSSKLFKHSSFSWDLLTPLKFFLTNQKELTSSQKDPLSKSYRSGVCPTTTASFQVVFWKHWVLVHSLYASHNRLSPEHSPMDTFPFCSAASLVQVPSETLNLDSCAFFRSKPPSIHGP